MELGQVSKMLAFSFVSELIKKKKVKKRNLVADLKEDSEQEFETESVDVSEMNFGDLEAYYKNVLSVIENTPEIRSSLVNSIKKVSERGEDLNDYYPSNLIAKEESLRKVLFLGKADDIELDGDDYK